MNHQWCQKMIDRVEALEARVLELETPTAPEIDAAVVMNPDPLTHKRRGRPPNNPELN